jgi:hypothetical protein
VYSAIAAEERNTPAVILVNKGFANDAYSAVPCESSVKEDVDAGVDSAMSEIIDALTKPLKQEEKSPAARPAEKLSRIVFKGDIQEINRFYYRRGWGDGLPIIPPTEEAVAEMLTGTDLPADHVVASLIPRLGKATVERIAVNAVMAGALPTYMPLLIAGVEILSNPASIFGTTGVSTGSWSPLWIINGPVRNDLHINSGTGALSPGNIANATIGRAMAFIIRNIGGARIGVEDMGVQGNPGKYSMVLAENEEESPWEPFHVEHGFVKEDSTISVSFPNCYHQTWPFGSDDEGILRGIICNITRPPTIVLTPPHAKNLARSGWTKQDIKDFIAEYARVPSYKSGSYWGTSSPGFAEWGRAGLFKNRIPMREYDLIPIVSNPQAVSVIVAGGPGAMIGLHMPGYARKEIRKVNLPHGWDRLVTKYKDLTPVYARY